MARKARERSQSGIYYVRITSERLIAAEQADTVDILALLKELSERDFTEIYAYYIDESDVYLVLKEGLSGVSDFVRGFKSAYAVRCNKKYKRNGPLFSGRFKSIALSGPDETLSAVAYLHSLGKGRPLPARTSCGEYTSGAKGIIEKEPVLLAAGGISGFERLHEQQSNFNPEPKRLTDGQLKEEIRKLFAEFAGEVTDEKFFEALKLIKKLDGTNVTQIARVLKVPRSVVEKA